MPKQTTNQPVGTLVAALICLGLAILGCNSDGDLPRAGQVGKAPADPSVRSNMEKGQAMRGNRPATGAKLIAPESTTK